MCFTWAKSLTVSTESHIHETVGSAWRALRAEAFIFRVLRDLGEDIVRRSEAIRNVRTMGLDLAKEPAHHDTD